MTLSNLTTLSLFTDNAPASPAYMNAKWAEVQANFDSIAVSASSHNEAIVYVHEYAGADASLKLTAALSAVTQPCVVDLRSLTGTQDWSSCVTVNRAGVQLVFGSSLFTGAERFLSIVSDDVRVLGGGIGITKIRRYDTWSSGQNQHIVVESSGVSRLEISGLDIESYVTGPLAKTATNYGIFLHDDATHAKGTSGFLVHHNRVRAYGNEPSANNRHLGIFVWTADSAPPRLVQHGAIHNNLLDACAGRNIEAALTQHLTIADNALASVGSNMTIVGVGIRLIGCKDVTVTGNVISLEETALTNSDGIQVNGDNRSEDVVIAGNAVYSSAGDGTGIKVSNCSRFAIVGNVLRYEGAGSGVNGILMECQSSNSTRAAAEGLVANNMVAGFTDAQITIAATPPIPQDITITGNRLGRPFGSSSDAKYFNISSSNVYADRIRIYGNSTGTTLGGVWGSNVTAPSGGVHSLIGAGTGLLPSIVSHQAALVGEITSTLSVGGQAGYAVIGVASTSDSTTSDRLYGGFFKSSANIGAVEIGLRAESADTNGVAIQWGVSKSTTKGQIDGAGTIRAFNGDGSATTLGYAFMSESSLGFYRSAASTIQQSYGTFVGPEVWAGSGLSVGSASNGGTLIPAISSTSSLIGAFVVQGSASSFTIVTWAAVKANDIVWVTPTSLNGAVSSLSSGIVAHSHCTQNGQIEMRLSNVSTLPQNVSSKTWYFTRITPF